jgi:hypothetical protein
MNTKTQATLPAPTLSLWQTLHDPAAFRRCILARLLTLQQGRAQMVYPLHTKPGAAAPPPQVTPAVHQQASDLAPQHENAAHQAFLSRNHHLEYEQMEADRHNFAAASVIGEAEECVSVWWD